MAGPSCSPQEIEQLTQGVMNGLLGQSNVRMHQLPDYDTVTSNIEAETRSKMGLFAPGRPMTGAFGLEFSAKALHPTTIMYNKALTFQDGLNKRFMDAFERTGLQRIMPLNLKLDQEVGAVVRAMDRDGNIVGPITPATGEVLNAARRIRAIYTQIENEHGVSSDLFLREYRPTVQAMGGPVFHGRPTEVATRLLSMMNDADRALYSELERSGVPMRWRGTASADFHDFTRALTRATKIRPQLEAMDEAVVKPFFGQRLYQRADGSIGEVVADPVGYKAWLDLKAHILGRPTQADISIAHTLSVLSQSVGRGPQDLETALQFSQGLSNMFYGGVLGFRPGSAIRQAFQLTNTFGELGARPTAMGLAKAIEAVTNPMIWQSYVERGLLTAPLETIHEQVGLARSAGRALSKATELALKMFDASDRFIKVATASAADFNFDEAMRKGIEGLKAPREVKEEVLRLVGRNQIDQARDRYAMHVLSTTQFTYGKTGRAEWQRGMLGTAIGMLASYPMNSAEMYIQYGKRALRGVKGAMGKGDDPISEALPLIRQLAIVSAIIYGGAELLGTDLRGAFNPVPTAPPVIEAGRNALAFGSTNYGYIAGTVFGTGETDYQKKLRADAWRNFRLSATSFVPGGVMGQEVYRIAGEPTTNNYLRMLGFPPLPEAVNIETREKATARRRERALERRLGVD